MFNVLLEVLPANFLLDRTWFIEDDTAYYISVHVVHDPKLPPGVWGGGGWVGFGYSTKIYLTFWNTISDKKVPLSYTVYWKMVPFLACLLNKKNPENRKPSCHFCAMFNKLKWYSHKVRFWKHFKLRHC